MKTCPQHVELGWGAPPISEQFEGFLAQSDLAQFDKDKEAISQLRLRGYLTDSAHKNAISKFTKALEKAIKKHKGCTP